MEALERAIFTAMGIFFFLLAILACRNYMKEEEALVEAVNRGRNRQAVMQMREYVSEGEGYE